MLSALNAFGGLSAAELLTLFGANSASSSSSNSTSKSAAPSTSPGISGSSANNPANAIQAILAQAQSSANNPANTIQAILAQAQIAQAQTATAGGGSASIVTAEAAYAAQTKLSGGGSATTVAAAAQADSSSSLPIGDIPFWMWTTDQQIANVTQFTQSLMDGSEGGLPFSVNAQVASATSAAQTPDGSATSVTAETVQALIGEGATNPGLERSGMPISVLAGAASAAAPGGSSSSASASATFLSPDLYQKLTSEGGSPISLAEAAYAAQTGDSSSLGNADITLSLPDTAQQIAYAVAQLNEAGPWTQTQSLTNAEVRYINPVNVTAADAVNVTIANGTMTATQGGALPSGLPSLSDIQQAINQLESEPSSYQAKAGLDPATYEGSLTLVQLPPNTNFACGDNFITLRTTEAGFQNWALVLPQNTVSVTVSDTQKTAG